jgi:hypothetical protein
MRSERKISFHETISTKKKKKTREGMSTSTYIVEKTTGKQSKTAPNTGRKEGWGINSHQSETVTKRKQIQNTRRTTSRIWEIEENSLTPSTKIAES